MKIEIKFRSFYNDKSMLFSDSYVDLYHFFELKPEDYPLMQYTGLKDKNGVDIYEGDIVRYIIPQDFITEYFSEVKFIEKESRYYPLACCGKNFEVIGNIRENPELLKP